MSLYKQKISLKTFFLSIAVACGFFSCAQKVSAAPANLLTNPGAERINFTGWNLTNSGDNGFAVNGDLNYVHSGNFMFMSSFDWDTMSQEIDLLAKGYTTSSLDSEPAINIGTFVTGHWPDPNDLYEVKVELRDASHNPIATFDTGQQVAAGDHIWTEISHTFTSYGPGVRYVYFEQDGHDAEFWFGNYGTVFDDASVTIGGEGSSLSITSPANGATISSWSPSVDWGNSIFCQYSYDGDAYTTVNCANNGSDIPLSSTSLTPTLYVLGVDNAGNSNTASSTFTRYTANSLTFGLVGYWKLDETEVHTCVGGNDVCDSTDNHRNGFVGFLLTPSDTTAPVLFTDPHSLSFDGSSDYVYLSNGRPVANDFTICAWIKTATPGNGTNHWQTAPILDAELGGLANDFGFGINSDGFLAYGNGGHYDSTVTGNTSVIDDQWHHACVTRNKISGQVTLYIDGNADATGFTDTVELSDSPDVSIGFGADGAAYYGGLMDDIRAYDRVLSDADITSLAQGFNKSDHTAPVITLLGSSTVTLPAGTTYSDAGATATDNVDGTLTNSITTTNHVNTNAVGTYTVTYNVTDAAGNAATEVQRTVNVISSGVGGLSSAMYNPPVLPVGGFKLIVNNGETPINNPNLRITFNAGSDIKYIALSRSLDFSGTSLLPYQPSVQWNVCAVGSPCLDGTYTIYAKFYTSTGQQSNVITTTINLENEMPVVNSKTTLNNGLVPSYTTFKQTLKRGSKSSEVGRLQSFLAKDASVYPEGLVTNYFGLLTLRAIQKFQIKYGITSGGPGFGIVGPATRAKLNEQLSKKVLSE